MAHLLLAVIYLAFVSLGLPDGLLGAAWPKMYEPFGVPVSSAGLLAMIIAAGTIVSSLQCARLTAFAGTGRITAASVLLTAAALFGFSFSTRFWMLLLFAVPYGLGAGAVDAALNLSVKSGDVNFVENGNHRNFVGVDLRKHLGHRSHLLFSYGRT